MSIKGLIQFILSFFRIKAKEDTPLFPDMSIPICVVANTYMEGRTYLSNMGRVPGVIYVFTALEAPGDVRVQFIGRKEYNVIWIANACGITKAGRRKYAELMDHIDSLKHCPGRRVNIVHYPSKGK